VVFFIGNINFFLFNISLNFHVTTFFKYFRNDFEKMLEIVQKDIQMALCEPHSQLAVGRLHQTLVQFLEMESPSPSNMMMATMMKIPSQFTAAIRNFISAKLESSPRQNLIATVEKLVSCYIITRFSTQNFLISR
jgi:hypothetical protein